MLDKADNICSIGNKWVNNNILKKGFWKSHRKVLALAKFATWKGLQLAAILKSDTNASIFLGFFAIFFRAPIIQNFPVLCRINSQIYSPHHFRKQNQFLWHKTSKKKHKHHSDEAMLFDLVYWNDKLLVRWNSTVLMFMNNVLPFISQPAQDIFKAS